MCGVNLGLTHTTIYLMRHAESESNAYHDKMKREGGEFRYKTPFNSPLGSDLTNKGIAQARDVARALKGISFDHIFSSDLIRAKRIAEIISSNREIEIQTTPHIREIDKENESEMTTRLHDWLQAIALKNTSKTVLVVTHGRLIRMFMVQNGFARYDQMPSGSIENTGFVILTHSDGKFNISDARGLKSTVISV